MTIALPKNWNLKPLGELADIKTGNKNNQDKLVDGEYPFFVRSDTIHKINSYSYDGEAILVPGEGKIGEVFHYINGKFDWHQRVYKISDFRRGLNGRFLHYYMQKNFGKQAYLNSVKATVDSLRLPVFQNFQILLPPVDEQKKIVEILQSVDKSINVTEKVINRTEQLKKALMKQFFTRGIGHTKFKQTEIGETPQKWKVAKFEDFCVLQRGFDLPKSSRSNGKYPLVTSNGITDCNNEYKVRGPGVVTGRSGTIGIVFYIAEDFWPLNTTLYIKEFYNNTPKFVYYFLNYFNLSKFSAGTGVPTLNRNIVHQQLIAFPTDILEQEKIAEILQSIDNKIEINKNLKVKQEQLKRGLMQDLLTGKVRV